MDWFGFPTMRNYVYGKLEFFRRRQPPQRKIESLKQDLRWKDDRSAAPHRTGWWLRWWERWAGGRDTRSRELHEVWRRGARETLLFTPPSLVTPVFPAISHRQTCKWPGSCVHNYRNYPAPPPPPLTAVDGGKGGGGNHRPNGSLLFEPCYCFGRFTITHPPTCFHPFRGSC